MCADRPSHTVCLMLIAEQFIGNNRSMPEYLAECRGHIQNSIDEMPAARFGCGYGSFGWAKNLTVLGERNYVTFALWHGPSFCRLLQPMTET